jgi:cytochrome c oxidase assembly protein subunit 15
MVLFRRLAIASTAATFLLVTIGGLVRATKSGLGCGTNWPDCPGNVTRALVIEFSHRAVAGLVVALLAALALTAFRHYRHSPALKWPALGAFALVMFQAVLGAVVVWLELRAESVVLHLGTALILLGTLIYLTAASLATAGKLRSPVDATVSKSFSLASIGVLLLLLVGSYVTGTGAGSVFPDWPLMDGRAVPDLSQRLQAVHFLHRFLAVAVGALVVYASVKLLRQKQSFPHQSRLAYLALGLLAVEIVVGAANVWTGLNAVWVTAHLFFGAAIWCTLVTITVISHPALHRITVVTPVGKSRPVLETT